MMWAYDVGGTGNKWVGGCTCYRCENLNEKKKRLRKSCIKFSNVLIVTSISCKIVNNYFKPCSVIARDLHLDDVLWSQTYHSRNVVYLSVSVNYERCLPTTLCCLVNEQVECISTIRQLPCYNWYCPARHFVLTDVIQEEKYKTMQWGGTLIV